MRRGIVVAAALLCMTGINAQAQTTPKKATGDWYNTSFEVEGFYGADVNRAYEFLKDKKVKARPIVAIIGGGIDIEHEALRENIWKNPKEKANGKDRDRNGYPGDVNGWNFIGGKDGSVMETTLTEGNREYLRLCEKYADYHFDGTRHFVYENGVRKYKEPENLAEYNYFRYSVLPESPIGGAYGGYNLGGILREYAIKFDTQMKQRSPGKSKYDQKDLTACWDKTGVQDSLANLSMYVMGMSFNMNKTNDWSKVYEIYAGNGHSDMAKESYNSVLKRQGVDNRKEIVGDDWLNLEDKSYGNNTLLTSNSASSTLAAGIIAGKRGIENRNNPIAENAQIMTLVTMARSGEPYLKDIALAIRYAVDKGASTIVLAQQNTLYPDYGKKWVGEALRYAESKGVLVVVPAWELSMDLSKHIFYPNRWMNGDSELTNLMVVSPSDEKGNPVLGSNYGAKEVDLYAPGVNMVSTYMGDTFQKGSGSLLSAATVAGVAALIETYYPELTATEIRQILLKSVTDRADAEVEKGILVNGAKTQDIFLFEELCLSGGIVNAYKAVKLADEMSSKK